MLSLSNYDLWTFSYPGFTTIKRQHYNGAYGLRVPFNARYLWTGLDWVSKTEPHVQLCHARRCVVTGWVLDHVYGDQQQQQTFPVVNMPRRKVLLGALGHADEWVSE